MHYRTVGGKRANAGMEIKRIMKFPTDTWVEAIDVMMKDVLQVELDPAAAIAAEHLSTGGKRLRARLAMEAGVRLGASAESMVPWAAACELLHNATLVHDDLQDGDRVRRGQPTMWVKYGAAQAINAGDLMWVAPYLALEKLTCEPATCWELTRLLARQGATVVRGQAIEWEMTQDAVTARETYLRAIRGKTSALFSLPVAGSAVLAGWDVEKAQTLAAAFGDIGLLFQMQDDVLDLFGNKGRAEVGTDLKEGKISALVAQHVALHPEDKEELLKLLKTKRDETSDESVLDMVERFRTGGALLKVCEDILEIHQEACHAAIVQEHPGIQDLMETLTAVILSPIEHVFSELHLLGK
ncbi:MAG: polyprenyl synthetase family protein [Deltaproteobacteria bacterium]|nr:polyprenyl synthetase family protein [Deltaproteobacteria bacterium]